MVLALPLGLSKVPTKHVAWTDASRSSSFTSAPMGDRVEISWESSLVSNGSSGTTVETALDFCLGGSLSSSTFGVALPTFPLGTEIKRTVSGSVGGCLLFRWLFSTPEKLHAPCMLHDCDILPGVVKPNTMAQTIFCGQANWSLQLASILIQLPVTTVIFNHPFALWCVPWSAAGIQQPSHLFIIPCNNLHVLVASLWLVVSFWFKWPSPFRIGNWNFWMCFCGAATGTPVAFASKTKPRQLLSPLTELTSNLHRKVPYSPRFHQIHKVSVSKTILAQVHADCWITLTPQDTPRLSWSQVSGGGPDLRWCIASSLKFLLPNQALLIKSSRIRMPQQSLQDLTCRGSSKRLTSKGQIRHDSGTMVFTESSEIRHSTKSPNVLQPFSHKLNTITNDPSSQKGPQEGPVPSGNHACHGAWLQWWEFSWDMVLFDCLWNGISSHTCCHIHYK